MHTKLRRGHRQLIRDVDIVQKDLEMLAYHHAAWDRKRQLSNLIQLKEHIKRLGSDLNTILSDCVSLGRQYWKDLNIPVIEGIHRSLAILNNVFNGLKKVRTAFDKAYIYSSELRQLIIDWGRLKKSIY